MLEMKYSSNRGETILDKGTYKGFNYVIVNYGTHPCCYVAIPQSHKFFEKHYDDINVDCHGGLTFSNYRDFGDGKEYYIGWDYAHFEDYTNLLGVIYPDAKKWTTEEMLEEVKKVIGQL